MVGSIIYVKIVLSNRYMCKQAILIIAAIVISVLPWGLASEWRSPYYADHSLVGKIYSLADNNWVTIKQLNEAISNAQILLLGETHTNLDHHQGQARLISQMPNPAIVMEMLTIERWQDQPLIWANLQDLQNQWELTAEGWKWDLYQPLLALAVNHQLPIFAANLSKQQRTQYAKQGMCQVERDGKEIDFCDTISADQKRLIEQLILDAHCGYLQAEHLPPLVNTQIAKDASFALGLVHSAKKRPAVLIAGAVHVRKDIGVPVHLQALGINSISIAFISVDPERVKAEQYFDHELGRQFDYAYFTPSERNTDPCEEFAEQLQKMNKKN